MHASGRETVHRSQLTHLKVSRPETSRATSTKLWLVRERPRGRSVWVRERPKGRDAGERDGAGGGGVQAGTPETVAIQQPGHGQADAARRAWARERDGGIRERKRVSE